MATDYMSRIDRYVYVCPARGYRVHSHGAAPADLWKKITSTSEHCQEAIHHSDSCYRTEAAVMSPTTHQGDDQGNPETEHNTGSTQEQTSTPSINSLEDLISIIGQHSGEGEAYRTLHLDAEK